MVDSMFVICSSQLLILKIHNNFSVRNEITEKIGVLPISIFLHGKTYALPNTSQDMVQNL